MTARVRFEDVEVGQEIPSLSTVVRWEQIKAYADASGDQNPIHQDESFARSVGLPGLIAHGMFSMARLTKTLTDWLGDPGALKSIDVQFRAMVLMDETLVTRGRILDLDASSRTARLEVWAEVDRDGQRQLAIKNSEAVVQLG